MSWYDDRLNNFFSANIKAYVSPCKSTLCFFFSIEKKLTSVGAFQQSTKKLLGGPHIFLGQFQH